MGRWLKKIESIREVKDSGLVLKGLFWLFQL